MITGTMFPYGAGNAAVKAAEFAAAALQRGTIATLVAEGYTVSNAPLADLQAAYVQKIADDAEEPVIGGGDFSSIYASTRVFVGVTEEEAEELSLDGEPFYVKANDALVARFDGDGAEAGITLVADSTEVAASLVEIYSVYTEGDHTGIFRAAGDLQLDAASGDILFALDNEPQWVIGEPTGDLIPLADNAKSIGTSVNRVSRVNCMEIMVGVADGDSLTEGYAAYIKGGAYVYHATSASIVAHNADGDLSLTCEIVGEDVVSQIQTDGTLRLIAETALEFNVDGTPLWGMAAAGHLVPATDDTFNIGAADKQVAELFVVDLTISGAFTSASYIVDLGSGNSGGISASGGHLRVGSADAVDVLFTTDNTDQWRLTIAGDLEPAVDNDVSLGVSNKRVATVWCTNINANLPTVDPEVAGQLWCDTAADFVVKVSQGA